MAENKRRAQTHLPDGTIVEREWKPRERFHLFRAGLNHGLAGRKKDETREGMVDYDRGYAEGEELRERVTFLQREKLVAFMGEVGYQPSLLRQEAEENT